MICTQCHRPIGPMDIFCGECGALVQQNKAAGLAQADSVGSTPEIAHQMPPVQIPPTEIPPTQPVNIIQAPPIRPVSVFQASPSASATEKNSASVTEAESTPIAEESKTVLREAAQPESPYESQHEIIADDLEVTRLVPSRQREARFELSFSTGGSFVISGSGLLGRNPKPETTEVFDQLVTFRDPKRTVSKTHLEFGSELGEFWVIDRNSVNGTYVHLSADGSSYEECIPGQRYLIPDGEAVGIGDEHFNIRYLK